MKKTKTKVGDTKLLTETELELMTILWRIEEGSVAEVMENLQKGRDLAYTSVSTILRILEQKGILKARKEGRGHIYQPQIKKSEYEAKTVRHVVERVFDGTPVALVRQLLDAVELNENDLKELKDLVARAGDRK